MKDEGIVPLTSSERTGRKPLRLVRAAVRMALVAYWEEEYKCLFVQHPTKGLELPGGAVDPGETALQTGLRELHEEAGIQLPAGQHLVMLASFPLKDPLGGNWLDVIYATLVIRAQLDSQQEAEFPLHWLTAEEIANKVNPQCSSYQMSLLALQRCPSAK